MSTFPARSFRQALFVSAFILYAGFARANDGVPMPSGGLEAYIARIDDSFRWHEVASGRIGDIEYTEYLLTSQTWRGIEWKHQFFLLWPATMSSEVHSALLFVHGGRWKPEYETERRASELPSLWRSGAGPVQARWAI